MPERRGRHDEKPGIAEFTTERTDALRGLIQYLRNILNRRFLRRMRGDSKQDEELGGG